MNFEIIGKTILTVVALTILVYLAAIELDPTLRYPLDCVIGMGLAFLWVAKRDVR